MGYYIGKVALKVNVREKWPSVRSPKAYPSFLKPGTILEISHAVKGKPHRGNDLWYVLKDCTFIWSGAVITAREIPVIEKKLIVTADDIGIVKEIDEGAVNALVVGNINSLAVFVNQPKTLNTRLEELKKVLKNKHRRGTQKPLIETTHIGLHFTITSGKPIESKKNVKALIDHKGWFKNFRDFTYEYERKEVVKQVKKEFFKQLEAFKEAFGKTPDHLTSHHDVLTFNRPLFEFLYEQAEKENMLIRSHRFLPASKRFWYDTIAIDQVDLPSINKMDRWEEEISRDVRHPDHTIVDHYGPLPPFPVISYQNQIRKKQERLQKWLKDFLVSKDSLREIIIHLMYSPLRRQSKLVRHHKALDETYKGINIQQFDGRVAEYLSLRYNSPWNESPYFDYENPLKRINQIT